MTGGHDPRRITVELDLAVDAVRELCEAQERAATTREIVELERFRNEIYEAAHAAYIQFGRFDRAARAGRYFSFESNSDLPTFDEDVWRRDLAELRTPSPGAAFKARLISLAAEPEHGKPRHREADAFPMAVLEELDERLAARKAVIEAGRTTDDELTHEAIANHLTGTTDFEFTRSRVQRAEQVRDMALEAKGWDLPALLRSHPEFRADNSTWRLPTPEKAPPLLGIQPSRQ